MAANGASTSQVEPMEVDKTHPGDANICSENNSIITWNYSSPEPELLKGFLNVRHSASKKLRAFEETSHLYKDFENTSKSLRDLIADSMKYRETIKNFFEQKSYLFRTPLYCLPEHPSFKRDFLSSNSRSTNGTIQTIDGLEVLSESYGPKANLPPTGELKRKELKVNTLVWAMKTNFLERFVQGSITAIRDNDLYKVRIDGGISKLYNPKQLAFRELCNVKVPVGTRIIARYSDGMYAGVVAEAPKSTNKDRYLIFFDDGYAQYIGHEDIRVVCAQSNDVSHDMNLEVRQFVQDYLAKYPERPMLKLQINQRIKTEYDFTWLDAKVLEVDCSMVHLLFLESNRREWLYRGSTRLKLLYDTLTNAESNRLTGKHRRHNLVPRNHHLPYVEYTRGDIINIDSDSDGESSSSQSTQNSAANGVAVKPKNTARKSGTSKSRSPDKTVTYTMNGNARNQRDYKSHLGSKEVQRLSSYDRNKFRPHTCSILCKEITPDSSFIGKCSPLAIPLHLGWERQIRKYFKNMPKVHVAYRAPCGRHLRNLHEIQDYIWTVSSQLSIDFFSLDPNINVFRFFTPKDIHYKVEDVSNGRENVKISCVNTWGSEPPPPVEYAAKRFPGKGVTLNEDQEFLIGCSCTDFCQNSSACECQQITNYAHTGKIEGNSGYKYRRLKESVMTGIYECNDRCKCGPQCGNRVIQNGLQVRLQMFKTQRKGWGIRCLDDLEAGMFICIYAGQLLTEQGADEEGRQLGDEYLAELDHIEVNERTKEGYESDANVSEMDVDDKSKQDSSPNSTDFDSDSDFETGLRTTASTTYSTRSKKKPSAKKSSNSTSHSTKENGLYSQDLPDVTSALDSYSISMCPLSPKSAAIVAKTKLQRIPKISEDDSSDKKTLSLNFPSASLEVRNSYRSLRSFYDDQESLFVMDAKTKGNIGRYLNHSCDPNLFVQSVFVNTHDLRFHEVAFFAHRFIVAGTELTWDYNYEVGSVTNKTMYCYCDSRWCRGRLL